MGLVSVSISPPQFPVGLGEHDLRFRPGLLLVVVAAAVGFREGRGTVRSVFCRACVRSGKPCCGLLSSGFFVARSVRGRDRWVPPPKPPQRRRACSVSYYVVSVLAKHVEVCHSLLLVRNIKGLEGLVPPPAPPPPPPPMFVVFPFSSCLYLF